MKKVMALIVLASCASLLHADYYTGGSQGGCGSYQQNYQGQGYQDQNYQTFPGYQQNYQGSSNYQGQPSMQGYQGQPSMRGQSYQAPMRGQSFQGSNYRGQGYVGSSYRNGNDNDGNGDDEVGIPERDSRYGNSYGNSNSMNPSSNYGSSYGNPGSMNMSRGYSDTSNQNTNTSNDQKLAADVKDSLQSVFSSKYNNVNVTVNNGYVTLAGTVPTQDDKTALEQKVRGMNGVRGISNQVTVQGQDQQGMQHSSRY